MVSRARVFVTLKAGVLDPQGDAVQESLASLGFDGVHDVRVGKVVDLHFAETSREDAFARLGAMATKLLANPVVENHRIELVEATKGSQ